MEGAGCAQMGAETTIAVTAIAVIAKCLISVFSWFGIERTLYRNDKLASTINFKLANAIELRWLEPRIPNGVLDVPKLTLGSASHRFFQFMG